MWPKKFGVGNEWYFPSSFALAWLARNHGATTCGIDPTSDEVDRTTAEERRSSQRNAGQILEERLNRAEAAVTAARGSGAGRAQMPEAHGANDARFGFGAFEARYQPENFSGDDTAWRDWPRVFRTWAGRFQCGRVQEIIRAVEVRPGEEATVTRGVADDFYHALILFCKGKAWKVVLTNKEGEGFEAWRALVNKYEPTSKARLAEILRTPFEGDFLDAITTFERKIMIYEA